MWSSMCCRLSMAVFVLALATSSALARQSVVVESTAPSFPPGQVIDDNTSVQLPAGTTVTLVADNGAITKLSGPFTGKPTAPGAAPADGDGDPAVVQALSRLFVANQPLSNSWGTFRGHEPAGSFRGDGESPVSPAQIWAINVRDSETVCALSGTAPTLWRADKTDPVTVLLVHLSTGREATITFPANVQEQPWPSGVPLLDGGEYAVRDANNQWERRMALRIVPADQKPGVARAAWMSDAGCFRQARAVLSSAL